MRETRWSGYYDDIELNESINADLSIYDAFCEAVDRYGDSVAVRYASREYTYIEFKRQIDNAASYFRSIGIQKGDNILIFTGGLPSIPISVYAASKIGAVVTFVNDIFSVSTVKKTLESQEFRMVIFTNKQLSKYQTILADIKAKDIIIASPYEFLSPFQLLEAVVKKYLKRFIYKINPGFDLKSTNIHTWKEVNSHEDQYVGDENCKIDSHDSVLVFRDENLGEGLLSVFSSYSLNEQAKQLSLIFSTKRNEKNRQCICLINQSMVAGFVLGCHALLLNGYTVLLRSYSFGARAIDQFFYYNSPMVVGFPSNFDSLAVNKSIRNRRMDFIESFISYGDPMSGGDYSHFYDFLSMYAPQAKIEKLFGEPETCSVFAYNPRKLNNDTVIGIPIPNVMVKIYDDNDSEVTDGTIGKILVSTPSYFDGYLYNEEKTSNAIRKYKDGRVWILTGDYGHIDSNGYLNFDGRGCNKIEVNGSYFFPPLLERIISEISGVNDCLIAVMKSQKKIVVAMVPDEEILFDIDRIDELKNRVNLNLEMFFFSRFFEVDIVFRAILPKTKYGFNDYSAFYKEMNEIEDDSIESL